MKRHTCIKLGAILIIGLTSATIHGMQQNSTELPVMWVSELNNTLEKKQCYYTDNDGNLHRVKFDQNGNAEFYDKKNYNILKHTQFSSKKDCESVSNVQKNKLTSKVTATMITVGVGMAIAMPSFAGALGYLILGACGAFMEWVHGNSRTLKERKYHIENYLSWGVGLGMLLLLARKM